MPVSNLPAETAARIAALVAALTAITVEDIAAVRAAGALGPDIPTNIENLQTLVNGIDAQELVAINEARAKENLPPV